MGKKSEDNKLTAEEELALLKKALSAYNVDYRSIVSDYQHYQSRPYPKLDIRKKL